MKVLNALSEAEYRFWVQFGRTMRTRELHVCVTRRLVFLILAAFGAEPLGAPDLIINGVERVTAVGTDERRFHGLDSTLADFVGR